MIGTEPIRIECRAAEELYNKYGTPREVEVPTTRDERIAMGRGKEKPTKIVFLPAIFCKENEKVWIVGDHSEIKVIENVKGERISVLVNKLILT